MGVPVLNLWKEFEGMRGIFTRIELPSCVKNFSCSWVGEGLERV